MSALKNIENARWLRGSSSCSKPRFRERRSCWRLVLLGPPGVGKGTQSQLLKQRLGTCHLSTGDLFRAACSRVGCNPTPAVAEAMNYMRRGELVPDSTVWDMVRERTECLRCRVGFLLDGFPRTLPQAEQLQTFLEDALLPLSAVVEYKMPLDEIIKRLSGRRVCETCNAVFHVTSRPPKVEGVCNDCGGRLYQRPDDCPASISVRMEAYRNSTSPLIEYYKDLGLLTSIDADGSADQVFARTMGALVPRARRGGQ
jgi:adenylate kinase